MAAGRTLPTQWGQNRRELVCSFRKGRLERTDWGRLGKDLWVSHGARERMPRPRTPTGAPSRRVSRIGRSHTVALLVAQHAVGHFCSFEQSPARSFVRRIVSVLLQPEFHVRKTRQW